eukprot:COSAG05_NODE_24_length_31553_cov_12.138647_28_plen_121_part_00
MNHLLFLILCERHKPKLNSLLVAMMGILAQSNPSCVRSHLAALGSTATSCPSRAYVHVLAALTCEPVLYLSSSSDDDILIISRRPDRRPTDRPITRRRPKIIGIIVVIGIVVAQPCLETL